MKIIDFKGCNDYNLKIAVWDNVESPVGIVQLSHGMAEHIERYDDFAKFLNLHNFIVFGDNHRAHGDTAEKLGVTPKGGNCFKNTVQDLIKMTNFAKEKYNLPVVLLGHSYGSFLAQSYIQKASNLVAGVVLSGSARQPKALVTLGAMLAQIQGAIIFDDKPAKLIDKVTFGGYNSKFDATKEFSWLTRDDVQRKAYVDDPQCGFVMSIGFFKSFFSGLKKLYKESSLSSIRKDLPIYIVSGDRDPVGDNGKLVMDLYDTYNDYAINSVEIKLYSDGRHEMLNEINNREVYDDLLAFANKCVGVKSEKKTKKIDK